MRELQFLVFIVLISITNAGISPVHDLKAKMSKKDVNERFLLSPQKPLKHFDGAILKATNNVTNNPVMEDSLYQVSKDLVSAILSKLELQDKITRITREALEAPGKSKGISAIETRRILDYISRTISTHVLAITKASTEPELHRLVYGLAQIYAETSIVSALNDITYATTLSKKQSVDLSLRKKRSLMDLENQQNMQLNRPSTSIPPRYNMIYNKTNIIGNYLENASQKPESVFSYKMPTSPTSVVPRANIRPIQIVNTKHTKVQTKGFLNQTALNMLQGSDVKVNETDAIVLTTKLNNTQYKLAETLDEQELNAPGPLFDEWADPKETSGKTSSNVAAEMENDKDEEDVDRRNKQKQERLEQKAKKAILYAGDVAYLTAASVVAMRRALTAAIEVQMSVSFARNGMNNHQDLMMNLARTAAKQAGKEAKSAASKSLACERVIKVALKYTAQSHGSNLSHIANRIVMDTLSYATLAKSMAFVSSDIAINSLYLVTDVKPSSK